jgi:tripartite-type tricarboxylate transporter receptor subunit TctC
MVPVPYLGSAPALNDMMGGVVDLMFDNLGSSLPLHEAGKLKIIAVPSVSRLRVLPQVRTFAEDGFPGAVSATWFALLAPPKTADAIRQKVSAAVADILAMG